jgi:hypothetical protein
MTGGDGHPGGQAGFIGRFHLVRSLGPGLLGDRHRARLYGLSGFVKEFCVELVARPLATQPGFLSRLVDAANAAAQLLHPGLARIHEVDVDGGRCFVVSDLGGGLSLADLLGALSQKGERLSNELALAVVLDVADALAYAHARSDLQEGGVLHLLLHPGQVLIDADGHLRVASVGLGAVVVAPGWDATATPGIHLAYVAPEVLAGSPATRQADVFSLGAILSALVQADEGSAVLAEVIAAALDPDPARRPASVAELRDRLTGLCADRRAARRLLGEKVAALAGVRGEPEAPLLPLEPPESSVSVALGALAAEAAVPVAHREAPRLPGEEALAELLAPPPTLPLSALRTRSPFPWRIALLVMAGACLATLATVWLLHPAAPPREAAIAPFSAPAPAPAPAPGPRPADPAPAAPAPIGALAPSPPRPDGPPARAPLRLTSRPSGARVFLDGTLAGTTPLSRELRTGAHQVVLALPGFRLGRQRLELPAGGAAVEVSLEPALLPESLRGSAALKVRCQSRGGLRLYIEGNDTGLDCPNDERLYLRPGRYRLQLYSPITDETIPVKRDVVVRTGRYSTRVYLRY